MLKKNIFIMMVFALLLTSCGSGTSPTDTTASSGTTCTGSACGGTTGSGTVTVSSNPTSISTYGTAVITATVKDASGNAVADGTSVTFTSNSTAVTLSSSTVTTTGGVATVTLTASGATGSVTVTATSGSVSGTVTISIGAAATGAVSLSASPSTISASGASTITASVVDSAGNPVVNGTIVSFISDNPSLGSISPASAATSSGNVTVTFTASTTAGTVNITATSGTITGSITITIGSATSTAAANIGLVATPTGITTLGSSSIQATVTTASGNTVADGTTVSFSVSSSTYGTVTSSATTSGGVATATFTALSVPGTVTITATADSASQTVAVIITAPANGSIAYTSATPQVLGIKGSGQTETSTIIFAVKDINGSAVVDGTSVSFTMDGPSGGKLPSNGGEYIGDISEVVTTTNDGIPTTATASTVSGNATVYLNSGSVAGPVTITASVTTTSGTVSATSDVVSIGGGAPSATHFNLATTKFNLPGLALSNSQATISAYIADRFGNYNVLTGTSVSFYTEAGAIDRSATLDATGVTSALFRTQSPNPADVSPDTWETTLISSLNSTYGWSIPTTTTPRDGWVTVLAITQGEEAFEDANANGLYDTGESFTDLGEPFYDKNDDGCRNDGTQKNCSGTISASTEPFEEYIDANGNGQYDGPNGVWDGPNCPDSGCQISKMIWTSITLVFTGNSSYCAIAPTSFAIANGGSQSFSFMVGDINTNHLVSGTTISVSASPGTLTGTTSYTILDGLPYGPTQISFTLADASPTDTDPAVAASVTVTVTGSGVAGCTTTITGTVD